MAIGLKTNVNVKGLKELQEKINYIDKLIKMKSDTKFQNIIKQKCLDTVIEIAIQNINLFPTSNEELKQAYISNNKIRPMENNNGFIIYNDLSVQSKNYKFCVALAFEYGTGLIGQEQNINGAWKYNVNQNTVFFDGNTIDGWWLAKSKAGSVESFGESQSGKAIITRGYQGMEIYRKSAEEIKKRLKKWVNEYKES